MRVAVCIKQVPDTEARLRVGADGRWVDEEDLPFVINESDTYALEQGLQIAEATGGEVVVFSLGPERVKEALRKALALGAARAVHLSDPALAGGDALATGRALAAAIAKEGFDLVLTGAQSDDLGYGATGPVIAGRLGWPHAWLVIGAAVEAGGASRPGHPRDGERQERDLPPAAAGGARGPGGDQPSALRLAQGDHGRQAQAARRGGGGRPRPRSRGGGAAGSRLEVLSVALPAGGEGAQMIAGDAATAARTLVEKLRQEARVL